MVAFVITGFIFYGWALDKYKDVREKHRLFYTWKVKREDFEKWIIEQDELNGIK
jgi:hypothetical protein